MKSAGRGKTGNMTKKRWLVIAAFLLTAGVALWFALSGPESEEAKDILQGRERLVLLDGEELAETVVSPGTGTDGLRTVIRLNDTVLADLPFGEEHTLEIIQKSGRNKVRMTADAVWMEDADCPGHDCVNMGKYTRDNWETRNMIVCLPHKLSVQVTDE